MEYLSACSAAVVEYIPSLLKFCDLLGFLLKLNRCKELVEAQRLPYMLECASLLALVCEQMSSNTEVSFAGILGLEGREDEESENAYCSLVHEDALKPSVRASLIELHTSTLKNILHHFVSATANTEQYIEQIKFVVNSISCFFDNLMISLECKNMTLLQSLMSSNDKDMIQILLDIEEIAIYCALVVENSSKPGFQSPATDNDSLKYIAEVVEGLFSIENCLAPLTLFVGLVDTVVFDSSFFVDLLTSTETSGLEYFLRALNTLLRIPDQFYGACCAYFQQKEGISTASDNKYGDICGKRKTEEENVGTARTVVWLERQQHCVVTKLESSIQQATILLNESRLTRQTVASVEWELGEKTGSNCNGAEKGEQGTQNSDSESDGCQFEAELPQKVNEFVEDMILFFGTLCDDLTAMRQKKSVSFDCTALINKLERVLVALQPTNQSP